MLQPYQIGISNIPIVQSGGPLAATFTVYTAQLPLTVALSGTGASIQLIPNSLNFTSLADGTVSAPQTITVRNLGASSVALTAFGAQGANPNMFNSTSNCGMSLAPSGTCTFTVSFAPPPVTPGTTPVSGIQSEQVYVTTAQGTVTAGITGTAVIPTFALSTPKLTFSPQGIGTSSAPTAVSVANNGTVNLVLGGGALIPSTPPNFKVTSNCQSVTLLPTNFCVFAVSFTPTTLGAMSAVYTLSSNAGPITLQMTGTGALLAARPAVALSTRLNPVTVGQPVVLTTQVSSTAAGTPTGQVQVKDGGTVLATDTLVKGVATFNLAALATGTHKLTAWYLGDSTHAASQSAVLNQVVVAKTPPQVQ